MDDPETFGWLLRAAELGDRQALDYSLFLLWTGTGLIGRDENRLKKLIELGSAWGHVNSLLAKAAYLEDTDPNASMAIYERVASWDDCRAQIVLALKYRTGIGAELNGAKSLFWWRLGTRVHQWTVSTIEETVPYFNHRFYVRVNGEPPMKGVGAGTYDCNRVKREARPLVRPDELSAAPFSEAVSDALLTWRRGTGSPTSLDAYRGTDGNLPNVSSQVRPELTAASVAQTGLTSWKPLAISFEPASTTPRPTPALYEELSKSIYVVVATPSERDTQLGRNIAQGSAVAVDRRTLLTNCHIVEGRPVISVATATGLKPLRVSTANLERDTCVLEASSDMFTPVRRIRRFDQLQIGEPVLSIGTPKGFDLSLSTGVVSQRRPTSGRRLIQTNAQISPGSSGGGLFDGYGNLIGVTTFKIVGGEGVNFALAIDDFLD